VKEKKEKSKIQEELKKYEKRKEGQKVGKEQTGEN
jgi:hypothetical protein